MNAVLVVQDNSASLQQPGQISPRTFAVRGPSVQFEKCTHLLRAVVHVGKVVLLQAPGGT